MAFYHWSEKGGTGEPLLFALWVINSNIGHTEVFSTYTLRCPHILAQSFPFGISQPLPFWAPPQCPGAGILARRCRQPHHSLPCLGTHLPASWKPGRFLTCEEHWCAWRLRKWCSMPQGVQHCVSALHPHPNLLLDRSSPLELLELLLAPSWGSLMLSLEYVNNTSSADGPFWFSSEKLQLVPRGSTVLWI